MVGLKIHLSLFFMYNILVRSKGIMKINQAGINNQSFDGKINVIGKISKSQNYLFNLHRSNLDKMIENKPYDLFVKQSNSKKTIMVSTDKDFKIHYMVRKNKQNFEECANYEIQRKDAKLKEEEILKRKELEEAKIAQAQMWHEYIKSKYSLDKLFYLT